MALRPAVVATSRRPRGRRRRQPPRKVGSPFFVATAALALTAAAGYDDQRRIESARLYGDVGDKAYYFVDLLVGSPVPQRTSLIADTGSTLAAFPCTGCSHCGPHLDAVFDVSRSVSAQWVPCTGTEHCARCTRGRCSYTQSYTEGSSIVGDWLHDYVSLGDEFQHNPPVVAKVGCHTHETRLFYTQEANGIFGMAPGSGGKVSILEDLFRDSAHIDSKLFAMCLSEQGGLLTVGGYNDSLHTADALGAPLSPMWIPMVLGSSYSIRLRSMEVLAGEGAETVLTGGFGSTIVDSGTTYTYLPQSLYRRLLSAVQSYCEMHDRCGATASGPKCWVVRRPENLASFPTIKVEFEGVAGEMLWHPESYMYRKSASATLWCYGFEDNGNARETVLGATWMMNRDVIFDLANRRLGLAEAKCPSFRDRPPPPTGRIDVAPITGVGAQAPGVFEMMPSWAPLPAAPGAARGFSVLLLAVVFIVGLLKVRHNVAAAAIVLQQSVGKPSGSAATQAPSSAPRRRSVNRAAEDGLSSSPAAGSSGGSGGGAPPATVVALSSWLRSTAIADGASSQAVEGASFGSSGGSDSSDSDGSSNETSADPTFKALGLRRTSV